ncbi:MAG: gluconate 2-dehydrogenase subunit 3 family protein [Thermoanaerobaculia bacterium]
MTPKNLSAGSLEGGLDAESRRTLAAATERILPVDGGRGAVETGVADYVARLLGRPRHAAWRGVVRNGLKRLDEAARELRGGAFAELPPDDQDALLRSLQERSDRLGRVFVDKLVVLCLEGFLCDPVHGGNRGGRGWRAVGVGPPAVGSPTDEPWTGDRGP